MQVDLPPAWAAAGSPTGVKQYEPVRAVFWPDYPASAPSFYLRDDFPRNLPHLQPAPRTVPPRPCLVLGSEQNLFFSRGINGMLNQLSEWLHKAARNELIDQPSGWEAVLRNYVEHSFNADLAQLRAAVNGKQQNVTYLKCSYTTTPGKAGVHYYNGRITGERTALATRFEEIGQSKPRDGSYYGNNLAMLIHPKNQADGTRRVVPEYLPETVSDLETLRQRAVMYGCGSELESLLAVIDKHAKNKKLTAKSLAVPIPVPVIFCVPRPRPLIGSSSDVELIGYLLLVRPGTGLPVKDDTPVQYIQILEGLTPSLLRRFNQQDEALHTRNWAALGAGSLGSKIVLHMSRCGRSPKLLVDTGRLAPRNFARHALFPMTNEVTSLPGLDKALALAMGVDGLGADPLILRRNVEDIVEHDDAIRETAKVSGWLWLNTTASQAARNGLALHATDTRVPRVAEAALFSAGRLGMFTLEGAGRNPDTGDLYSLALQRCSSDASLAYLMFSAESVER